MHFYLLFLKKLNIKEWSRKLPDHHVVWGSGERPDIKETEASPPKGPAPLVTF
jgi:hypothetical protein